MNKYCYIEGSIVITIEDEYIDIFPNIHITKRFSPEFIGKCVIVDESVEVHPGMLYRDGEFHEPPEPEPVDPDDPYPLEPGEPTLEERMDLKLAQSTTETLELIVLLNEMQRLEQAQSNAELIELMMSLQGGI